MRPKSALRARPTARTYQAMEALIHNLNTMHSRAGAQTPFSSINYGMDTSPEARMVMQQPAAGHGRRAWATARRRSSPIQIFRVKEGVNYNPGDPNYDLFKLAMPLLAPSACSRTSRFLDAPFNLKYYKPGHPETEIAYMGCRTRVIGNVYDPTREVSQPAAATCPSRPSTCRAWPSRAKGDIDLFFEPLDAKMELVWSSWMSASRFRRARRCATIRS